MIIRLLLAFAIIGLTTCAPTKPDFRKFNQAEKEVEDELDQLKTLKDNKLGPKLSANLKGTKNFPGPKNNEFSKFTGIQYSPSDLAEYILRTGDEEGVALAVEELFKEGIVDRVEAIDYLQEVKNIMAYLKSQIKKMRHEQELTKEVSPGRSDLPAIKVHPFDPLGDKRLEEPKIFNARTNKLATKTDKVKTTEGTTSHPETTTTTKKPAVKTNRPQEKPKKDDTPPKEELISDSFKEINVDEKKRHHHPLIQHGQIQSASVEATHPHKALDEDHIEHQVPHHPASERNLYQPPNSMMQEQEQRIPLPMYEENSDPRAYLEQQMMYPQFDESNAAMINNPKSYLSQSLGDSEMEEKLKAVNSMYQEYTLEEIIFQLARNMFAQSLSQGDPSAEESLNKLISFMENEVSKKRISQEMKEKILEIMSAALVDTLKEYPTLMRPELPQVYQPSPERPRPRPIPISKPNQVSPLPRVEKKGNFLSKKNP